MSFDFKQYINQVKSIDLDFDYKWENVLLKKIDISQLNNWEKLSDENILSTDSYVFYKLNSSIKSTLLDNSVFVPEWEIIDLPNVAWHDFVLKVKEIFDINKDKFQNIKQFADEISKIISSSNLEYLREVSVQWVFVNLNVSNKFFIDAWNHILSNANNYGNIDFLKNEKTIVEYSSPNMAKQMTVWHFRWTIIGQILWNIVYKAWTNLLRWNYLGDWWTPYGKNLYSLTYFYSLDLTTVSEEEKNKYQWFTWENLIDKLNSNPISTLEFLYSSFKDIQDPMKEEKARHYFKLLEQWYQPLVELWEVVKKYSLIDFDNVYKRLWVHFWTFAGEAFTQGMIDEILSDIEKSGYIVNDNWVLLVKFIKSTENWSMEYIPLKKDEIWNYDEKDLTVMLLKKSDWATLYATRDMVNIKIRSQLGASFLYYCVWNEQSLHLQTVFALADKVGYISKDKVFHIWNWLFLIGWEKMSSRKWNVHRMAELLDLVKEKINEDFQDKVDENTFESLAISAVIFNEIKNDRAKDMEFNIENMTRINWDTWVYVQYSKVRMDAIINKLKIENLELKIWDTKLTIEEKEIIKLCSYLPVVIKKSIVLTKPHVFAQYLLTLCQKFNSWYTNSPKVLEMSEEEKISKYAFLNALKVVFKYSFEILNFPNIEKM